MYTVSKHRLDVTRMTRFKIFSTSFVKFVVMCSLLLADYLLFNNILWMKLVKLQDTLCVLCTTLSYNCVYYVHDHKRQFKFCHKVF